MGFCKKIRDSLEFFLVMFIFSFFDISFFSHFFLKIFKPLTMSAEDRIGYKKEIRIHSYKKCFQTSSSVDNGFDFSDRIDTKLILRVDSGDKRSNGNCYSMIHKIN